MAIKKKPEEHENHERWLISYADFITLLFAFFVVMYSSSSRDLANVKKLEVSLMKSFGSHSSGPMEKANGQPFTDREATRAAPINNMYSYGPGEGMGPEIADEEVFKESDPLYQLRGRVEGIVRSNGAQGSFRIKLDKKGLFIVLTEARVFSKTNELKQDPQRILLEIAGELQGMDRMISIEGTAVPCPERSVEASQNLASVYAGKISAFLKEEGRIPASKLRSRVETQESAGFTRPEDLEDGTAIDIVITRELVD